MNGHQNSGTCKKDQCSMVPLSYLISRELQNEKLPRPTIRYGLAMQPKKGEDFAIVKPECQRIPGDRHSSFSVFAVLDGHNGTAAAAYAKENLWKDVLCAIQPNLSRDEWLAALPKALVSGFVKTDKQFRRKEQLSGTSVTFVVVDGWTVTVASVGDSQCILDSQGGSICTLTVNHRLEDNTDEQDRVRACGGEVGRLSLVDGVEIGPLRCWPGGLCLSRSIGDMDGGEFIVPIPHVKQIKLSNAGGRLIIASDGVWDALNGERVAKCSRGLPAELAAKQVVKEVLKSRGLRDDTTCLIVDIMPPKVPPVPVVPPPIKTKKQNKIKAFLFRKKHHTELRIETLDRHSDVSFVDEILDQGSAFITERVAAESVIPQAGFGLFRCTVCQADLSPREGISVHAGSFFSTSDRPWEGPFLCLSCKMKKDVKTNTMERIAVA